jgi:TM2 domain-containing membrane protein YozV
MNGKSKMTTLILCFFFGYLGVHRFYTGHTKTGIIQLFTAGGLGIWAIWDFIMILLGKFQDGDGRLLTA